MPLLPSGLQDTLAPTAARDRVITNALLDRLALFGYAQVAPPLLEFEDTMLNGKASAHEHNTFRVMDPASQKMMGLRSDITPQIERIARHMVTPDAPLARLSYAGHVLRVSPSGLCPKRQLRQAGIEMIGQHTHVNAIEPLTALIEALQVLGLSSLTVSLCMAGLLEDMLSGCAPQSQEVIKKAIYHKDVGSLPEAMPHRDLIAALMSTPLGRIDNALLEPAQPHLSPMLDMAAYLQDAFDGVHVLCDPLDTDGFAYHDGLCFTLLDNNSRQEIGRGGSYALEKDVRGCGGTLYIDRLITTEIAPQAQANVQNVSRETRYASTKELRDRGITTLYMND